ncbi:hypothetical protein LX99_01938 [Mucilaginibacter oryzae]|uniref:Uncharacterized protein n=1 Tax=Mucilaginibacter oryzae TaxID=468058 RepID=A0A316HC62_9SPHI|nr:hypothetical protein [Mucilaginibacter oryzae]PWK78098.1 hypothetical protein LX99_01938 [Mucilaginibacter oryzae]
MSGDINTDQTQPGEESRRNNNRIKILGFNLLALIVYTLLCKLINDVGSLMLEAFLVFSQVLICLVLSAVRRDVVWLLSAFMVLAIGFSTCVYVGEFRL